MDQVISTGLQMMQMDILLKQEPLCVIRALNTISFDDLHKIICHKLSISSSIVYSFYLPKADINIRKITRSFDECSASRLAAFIQTGDTIYYRIYNAEFHIRFSSMGVVDEALALQAKMLVTQSKIKHVLKKENITYCNEISNVTTQQLFNLSVSLFDERIYQYFPDQCFLMLHIDHMLQPIYIENQDDQFLLYFFQDEISYRRFYCILKDTLPGQSMYKYKQASVLRFGKQPVANIFNHLCKDTYIAFLDMQRGWELDGISEDLAHDFLITLPMLLETVRSIRVHQMNLHKQHGILHIYDVPNRPLKLEMKMYESMVLPVLPYKAQHNIDVLLETTFMNTYIEMDYRFICQTEIPRKGERRPFLLNVSAIGPTIQSHYEHSFEKEEDIRNAFLDMFMSIIEENGRPQTIKVKDRYVFSLLYDVCSKLGIYVQIEPKLMYIEAYYVENKQVIYDVETTSQEQPVLEEMAQPVKKAVVGQPLQHQYSRKRYKMKAYFN